MSVLIRLLLAITLFTGLACSSKEGCRDQKATNFDGTADKDCNGCCVYKTPNPPGPGGPSVSEGSVMFWTDDLYLVTTCQEVTVKISNGSNVTITGSFTSTPTSCTSSNGGYISLPPGDYTYTVTTKNCQHPGGTFSITSNKCAIHQI